MRVNKYAWTWMVSYIRLGNNKIKKMFYNYFTV